MTSHFSEQFSFRNSSECVRNLACANDAQSMGRKDAQCNLTEAP